MKQISISKGKVLTEEVSAPQVENGFVLIKTAYSCISAGTEMAGVERSKKNVLQRVFEKPEKLHLALDLLKKHGIQSTLKQIKDIGNTPFPSGYSVSGEIVDLGSDTGNFAIGDKVAAAGGGYAIHAEYVLVPRNLVVKIPQNVLLKEASVATIGAIALHGVHRAGLILGEKAVVIGCGIIGLFTVQLLKASGVQVAAIDVSDGRLEKAKEMGADICFSAREANLPVLINNWSDGVGVDAVLFAAATQSSEPLSNAFQMCRRKGKVVLVGVSGMEINRADIYQSEIDFLISSSYGPGRYDKNYEELGQDYPISYVRWTENRNIAEFLRLIGCGSIKIKELIDGEFPIEEAERAFKYLKEGPEKPLIVLLNYKNSGRSEESRTLIASGPTGKINSKLNIGLIGVGNFTRSTHIPNLNKLSDKYQIYGVASRKGLDSKTIGIQNHSCYSTTNPEDLINDSNIDLIFISTRHDSHGELTLKALKAGKHVFVEKPLAINEDELKAIEEFYSSGSCDKYLMVGFNRRFSKYAREIKKHVEKRINPLFIRYRMNAGYLPADHWVFNSGGRIIGEACHIIDLMSYLTASKIIEVNSSSLAPSTGQYSTNDNRTLTLKYEDGSVAAIDYFSCGNPGLNKEFCEIHFDNKSIILDDYKQLKGYGVSIKSISDQLPNKGHLEELEILSDYLTGKTEKQPILIDDQIQTTYASILLSNI